MAAFRANPEGFGRLELHAETSQCFLAGPWLQNFLEELKYWQNSEQSASLLGSRPTFQDWTSTIPPEGQWIPAGEKILSIQGPSYLIDICARPILRMTSKLAGIAHRMSQLWNLPFAFVDLASEAEHPVDAAWCARSAWLAGCAAGTLGGPGHVPGLEICGLVEGQLAPPSPCPGSIGTFFPVPAGDLGSSLEALTHLAKPPQGLWLGDDRDWRDAAIFRRALDRRGWGTTRLLFLGTWDLDQLPAMRAARPPIDLMGTPREWPPGPQARAFRAPIEGPLTSPTRPPQETSEQIKERVRAGYRR